MCKVMVTNHSSRLGQRKKTSGDHINPIWYVAWADQIPAGLLRLFISDSLEQTNRDGSSSMKPPCKWRHRKASSAAHCHDWICRQYGLGFDVCQAGFWRVQEFSPVSTVQMQTWVSWWKKLLTVVNGESMISHHLSTPENVTVVEGGVALR